eukprot:CAMPEP_0172508928 /NCGR_PEP_ID=MMETSP1066-20121228/216110_1 /TAXON_ID=671091 /ORGANISM="Coscinodiscus wailesii, Strain CCMP2513" /LENGTH=338 /DNA_ID=CAMNT_0013287161 /DNA_START=206 /DNA_END=1222 /DNA_ORIENTATION=-
MTGSIDKENGTVSKKESQWTVYDTEQDSSLLPTIAVLLWIGWMGIDVYLLLYLIFIADMTQRAVIISIVIAVTIPPPGFPMALGERLGKWSLTQSEKYFGMKTTLENEESIKKISQSSSPLIFAHEPHDVLPFPMAVFSPYLPRLRYLNCACLVTSAIFHIPFLRQMYTWTHCESVDKKTFRSKLLRNECLVFCPGGVQEVTMMDPAFPDDVLVYLKTRKGFIKLALETGASVVPSFGFNTDGCYGYWIPRGKVVNKIARSLGFLPMVFWGRFGIPFGIPKPKKIHVVVGEVIKIPKVENVTNELVDKWHGVFLTEMEALFERHKKDAGYAHRKLKIL